MNIDNFRREIDEIILDRGFDYWVSGAVKRLEQLSEGRYKAVVTGSEVYTVTIQLDKEGSIEHSCSCPYDYGPVCKHVVAVLFTLAEGDAEHAEPEKSGELETILNRLGYEQLLEIIRELTVRDPALERELLARFSDSGDERYLHYCNLLHTRINQLRVRDGYISYYQAKAVGEEVSSLVERARELIGDDEYGQAIPILHAVCTVMVDCLEDADDSDGSIGGAIDEAVNCFREMAETPDLPEEIRSELFSLLSELGILRSFSDYSFDLDLLSILPKLVETEAEEKQLLSLLARYSGADSSLGSFFGGWYEAETAARICLSLYRKRRSAAEVEAFIRKHGHMPSFRKLVLQQQLDRGDYAQLYAEAEAGILHDAVYPGLVYEWREWILTGAQAAGDTELVKKTAWKLLLDSRREELEILEVLKSVIPDNKWPEMREKLFAEMEGTYYKLIPIYIHEELFDRLWEVVTIHPTVESFLCYGEYLLPQYAEEMAELSEELVFRRLQKAGTRQYYAETAALLRMLREHGAKRQAEAMASAVLNRYTNRPAMRDEFRAAGF